MLLMWMLLYLLSNIWRTNKVLFLVDATAETFSSHNVIPTQFFAHWCGNDYFTLLLILRSLKIAKKSQLYSNYLSNSYWNQSNTTTIGWSHFSISFLMIMWLLFCSFVNHFLEDKHSFLTDFQFCVCQFHATLWQCSSSELQQNEKELWKKIHFEVMKFFLHRQSWTSYKLIVAGQQIADNWLRQPNSKES